MEAYPCHAIVVGVVVNLQDQRRLRARHEAPRCVGARIFIGADRRSEPPHTGLAPSRSTEYHACEQESVDPRLPMVDLDSIIQTPQQTLHSLLLQYS